MKSVLKFIHFISIIFFLGSIFTYILISALTQNQPFSDLAFGRKIIGIGTARITLPSMWVILASGLFLGKRNSSFFKIKLSLGVLLILNAYLFVSPAVNEATSLAILAVETGKLSPEFQNAYYRESFMGAINVFLSLFALWFSIKIHAK